MGCQPMIRGGLTLIAVLIILAPLQVRSEEKEPLLAAVERVSPENLPGIKNILAQIVPWKPPPPKVVTTVRDLGGATPREAREIAENPTFARAYDSSAAATLHLLRQINDILDHSTQRH